MYKAKDTVNRKNGSLQTKWENSFTNSTSDRGLISKIFKELKKLDINKKVKTPIKNWGADMNRILNRRISNG